MTRPQHPVRKPHRLLPAAYTDARCAYFFTVCARQHGEPFRSAGLARAVIDSLLWTRDRYGWELYGYCLMPDHLHFVCRPTERECGIVNAGARGNNPEGVLDHLARFKSFTTRKAWDCGLTGLLWPRSSYDVILDESRSFEEVVHYVLDNPVRKGLVKVRTGWPYSGIADTWA